MTDRCCYVRLGAGCRRQNVTKYNVISIFGMHAVALLGALAMQSLSMFNSFIDRNSFVAVLGDGTYWMVQFVGVAACILPVEAIKVRCSEVRRHMAPTCSHARVLALPQCYLRYYKPNNERILLFRDVQYVGETCAVWCKCAPSPSHLSTALRALQWPHCFQASGL